MELSFILNALGALDENDYRYLIIKKGFSKGGNVTVNKEIEKIIVKAFFNKKIQERFLFELGSKKKRDDAISRLAHNFEEILKVNLMKEIDTPNSDYEDIERLLRKYGAADSCYIIAWDETIDGKTLPLSATLQSAVGNGQPVIVSCIHGKLAYFEAEQVAGPPSRFILESR